MTSFRFQWQQQVSGEELSILACCERCQDFTIHVPSNMFIYKGWLKSLLWCQTVGCNEFHIVESLPPLPPTVRLFRIVIKYSASVSSNGRDKKRTSYLLIASKKAHLALKRAKQLTGVTNRFGVARYNVTGGV